MRIGYRVQEMEEVERTRGTNNVKDERDVQ